MFDILLDTADNLYIEKKWEEMKHFFPRSNIAGVTTNPNAFYKTDDLTLDRWKKKSLILSDLLNEIRGDTEGVLHLQFPNSNITEYKFLKWIEMLNDLNFSNKIAIKVPPFRESLDLAITLAKDFQINVTGISDAGTALFVLNRDIHYASMIPGRMEEAGIDAKAHISYVLNSKINNKKVITGSMRTIEGFKWCVEFGTLPTIGTRVLDLLTPEVFEQMQSWTPKNKIDTNFCPLNTEVNAQLSTSFFEQMDEMGIKAYEDLK